MQWLVPLKSLAWEKLKLFKKEEKAQYFLALVLLERSIEALVFKKQENVAQTFGRAVEKLSASVEEADVAQVLEAVDRVIAQAEEKLPPNIFVSQTVLGLKDSWIEDGKIKNAYLPLLKKLKEELDLVFLGFICTTEAVAHLLQREEGVPLSAILISRDFDILTVAAVRAGKIDKVVSKKVEEEKDAKVVEKILRTFKEHEVLPSRFIIFGDYDLEALRQELISFPWTKVLPFLHFPKIEVASPDFIDQAIAAGFAAQMNVQFEEEVKKKEEDEPNVATQEQDVSQLQQAQKPRFRIPGVSKLASLRDANEFIFPKLDKLSILLRKIPKRKFPLILLPITAILTVIILLYVFVPRATVTLYLSPKVLEQEGEVKILANVQAGDLASSKIKGEDVAIELAGTQESVASGKKEVGEKAKGEVTIFNSSTEARTLAQGTAITAPGNFKFTLDEKVAIASASGDVFSGTAPSKAKIAVTAQNFGEESNLPSGTVFTVSNLTNIAAKNENAFSGGSKKEAKVVSRQDQEKLNSELVDKLTSKAREELVKATSGRNIIDNILTHEVLEKKWSHDVDSQTDKFTLTLKLRFKTISFSEQELRTVFAQKLKEQVPQDFVLKEDDINISFVKTKLNRDKTVDATVSVKANLLPKIVTREVQDKIKGKKLDIAFTILGNLPNVSDYKIKISPVFPLLPKILPQRRENIKIETQ